MGIILDFYTKHQDWINLVKDLVFFFGVVGIIKYLFNRHFVNKSDEIRNNLKARDDIEDKLSKYVLEKHNNNVNISIRFVHWKNYPWNLGDDGYEHQLFVRTLDERTLPSGWIDNTGLNFEESLSFFGKSIYVDQKGIFFIAKKDTKFEGFKELPGKSLILRMPFSNIVNFDFKTYIEYEPIFYIKHKYNNYKKLYEPIYICRESSKNEYFSCKLDRRYKLKSYHPLKYTLMKTKVLLLKKFEYAQLRLIT